jgi:hypothetical protein
VNALFDISGNTYLVQGHGLNIKINKIIKIKIINSNIPYRGLCRISDII